MASIICLPRLKHNAPCALCLARDSAGNNIAARIAMMAMTTSSSIKVNAPEFVFPGFISIHSDHQCIES